VDSNYLKEACKKDKDRLFSKACYDRTRGNGFKLKEGRQTSYREEIFYSEGGESLAQIAQRGGRCPIPGKIQDQVGQGSEQPDLLIWLKMSLLIAWGLDQMAFKCPFQPKLFYDSMIPHIIVYSFWTGSR